MIVPYDFNFDKKGNLPVTYRKHHIQGVNTGSLTSQFDLELKIFIILHVALSFSFVNNMSKFSLLIFKD